MKVAGCRKVHLTHAVRRLFQWRIIFSHGRPLLAGLCILALAAAAGCRERAPTQAAPEEMFVPSGGEQVRELGIYSGKERVGDLRMTRMQGAWQGEKAVQVSESVHLRLSFRGDRFTVSSSQVSWVGEDLDLKASKGSMDFGAGSWETSVVKVHGNAYDREQVNSGSRSRDRIEVPDNVIISDVLPLYLEDVQVEVNGERKLGVFNMTLGQEFPLTLRYRGVTSGEKLYTLSYWGMEERLWIDETGMIVREDMAMGVSARVPGAADKPGYLALETVLSQTAVPGVGIPEDLSNRQSAVLVLEGSFRSPSGGKWQRVEAGERRTVVTLTRPVIPSPGQRDPDGGLMPGDRFGLDLDSPRIKALAEEITGSLEDPWEKAVAIARWVNTELGKSMRECFSALQVLESGEGECQSHSLLMVSLCRAAGLPARFAYGVVYLPDREAFGFHTWVQVHTGEWIPMDPTLGNFPAGVDHLTLAVGGYQDQFGLFPYILGKGGWRIRFSEQ